MLDFGLAKVTSEGQSDSGLTTSRPDAGHARFHRARTDPQYPVGRHPRRHLQPRLHVLLSPDRRTAVPRRARLDVYQAHFSMNAEPLNLVRPEVPVELAALVAKMMAKAPVRRFQTPAEVAQAIMPFLHPALGGSVASNAQAAQMGQQGTRRESREDRPMSAQSATNSAAVPAPAIKKQAAAAPPEPSWESLIKFKETQPLRGSPVAARLSPHTGWVCSRRQRALRCHNSAHVRGTPLGSPTKSRDGTTRCSCAMS